MSFGTRDRAEPSRILAVLGPTNTGKTHLAIERMLGHRTGMIGFPLRLLARENYDKIVRLKGRNAVALVTGEEKILPSSPSYWVCTVESMPLDRVVSFLAIDEIQMCGDRERGHIFTDRLLHARGLEETIFIGAETIRPLIQRLVPGVEFITRPRFSSLTYAGYKKLTRLPPRSAVVSFSASDVYAMAELIRRQRGGTAVVLGALSPRTRNAQVEMYQAGEVDYLVATDAIGMGLNMDIDHVAFAKLTKFDGQSPRRLRPTEIAQVAGRAGRHMANGTFGTTADVGELEPELVEAVEAHRFDPLKAIMWRNSDLDFRSPRHLLKSLDAPSPHPALMRARDADDQLALAAFVNDPEIERITTGKGSVQLLWDVCQIPDFRKVLSEHHAKLLGQIYRHLRAPEGVLPTDWVANQVNRLDRSDGDIDALVVRISHVRTWTYISHRPNWLAEPEHWQECTRAIEDKLSDALHERLTQRFVDRRSAFFIKSQASGGDLLAGVQTGGDVVVEGHHVGRLEGFRFTADPSIEGEDIRSILSAARRALKDEIANRVNRLEKDEDAAFVLHHDGVVTWHGDRVARLTPGGELLSPVVLPLDSELLGSGQSERLRQRIVLWLNGLIEQRLRPLMQLPSAELTAPARGVAFQLVEALGSLPRSRVEALVRLLPKSDRQALHRLGVRLGAQHVFLPALLKPRAVELRALLWSMHRGLPLVPATPAPGRVSVEPDPKLPRSFYEAIGFPVFGPRAVRVDILDRVARWLRLASKPDTPKEGEKPAPRGAFALDPTLANLLGVGLVDLDLIVQALGYRQMKPDQEGGATLYRFRPPKRPAPERPDKAAPPSRPVDESSPFAVLKRLAGAR